jgi:hypothetical protein
MRGGRVGTGWIAAGALLAGSVSPALAHDRWDRDGWGRHHHHHRDRGGFGFGDAVGIAALIGAVAIIASSAKKDRDAKRDQRGDDDAVDRDAAPTGQAADEETAVDACALAARDEASRDGRYAEVREITRVGPVARGWDVDGTVDQRDSVRASGGETRRFSCTYRDGRVADVILSRDSIAMR